MQDDEIRPVELEYYYLTSKEFTIQRELSARGISNRENFEVDLKSGELKRYAGGFLAYKAGVRCGHHSNRLILETYTFSRLTTENLEIFEVPKKNN